MGNERITKRVFLGTVSKTTVLTEIFKLKYPGIFRQLVLPISHIVINTLQRKSCVLLMKPKCSTIFKAYQNSDINSL